MASADDVEVFHEVGGTEERFYCHMWRKSRQRLQGMIWFAALGDGFVEPIPSVGEFVPQRIFWQTVDELLAELGATRTARPPGAPKDFPKRERTLSTYRKAYRAIKRLRQEQFASWDEGARDTPGPTLAELQDAVAYYAKWKTSTKTIRKIRNLGDAGWLD